MTWHRERAHGSLGFLEIELSRNASWEWVWQGADGVEKNHPSSSPCETNRHLSIIVLNVFLLSSQPPGPSLPPSGRA